MNTMLYPIHSVSRRVISLDGLWKFQFDRKEEGLAQQWHSQGLPDPISMPVPASFNDFFTDKESREFCGDFWYETEVFVPGEWEGQTLMLRFGAATHRASVYVNGIVAGSHEGGFLPFALDITAAVRYNAANRICVKINNQLSHTSLPAGRTVTLANGTKICKPYFDFYNYGGLNRSVHLVCLPRERIEDFEVVHALTADGSRTDYKVVTTGDHKVSVQVYDADGNLVSESEGKTGSLAIKGTRLWQVRNAYLYRFVICILDGDTVLDEYFDDIGIRTVEIRDTDILLNGKPIYLKGFGKHEDSDIMGRAFNMAMMKRDFELMKWIGANSFRTAHYPTDEAVCRMADREGILIVDEVPAVGFYESLMNFADAGVGASATKWFSQDTVPQLLENHKNALRELITRDKNRACVIAWSLFNEPDTTDPQAAPYFQQIFNLARELDPQKRPRTWAQMINSGPHTCHCYQFSDFISLNRYYGWYISGGYELSNAEDAFRKELAQWQALNLNKPFVMSEYGADTMDTEHRLPATMWSQEYQREYLEMNNRVLDECPLFKGEHVWVFADFQASESIARVGGVNRKGVFTRQRQPKDAAYLLKKRWESLPLDYKSGK